MRRPASTALVIWENAKMTAVPYQTEAEALAHMALKGIRARRSKSRETESR
jgi:hypothetical protein